VGTLHEEHPDFPSPIPWLGKPGPVEPLDRPLSVRTASGGPAAPRRRDLPIANPLPLAPPPREEDPPHRRRLPIAPGQVPPAIPVPPPAEPVKTPEVSVSQAADLDLSASPPKGRSRAPAKKKRGGSGIPARSIIRKLVWARRGSQVFFIGLFLFLLFDTAFRGTFSASSDTPVRLSWPVEGFLLTDPFVAAMTLLSTHTVYRGLAWSLAIVGLTLTFGRVFCGWICPFGTMHHFFAWIFPSRYVRGKQRVEANHTKGWQLAKYYLMLAFLGAAVTGSAIGGLFDPICIAVRAVGLGVLPALQYLGIRGGSAVADTNVRALQAASDVSQDFLSRTVWTSSQLYFHQTWFITFLLIATLFMNRFIPRFWCRALCPLGAFLGIISRFALFGMEKDHAKCTDCNLCLVHCQGADSPEGGVKHRQDECHMCFNCEAACPEDVIKFRFLPNRRGTASTPDLGRRTALASAAAGAVAIPVFRIADWPDRAYSEKVIRPPGAVEEREFLERCIRCAECMKVCPNNALHPAFFEAGVEGLWTPILIPRIGYCEFSCVLCGQVCPTGAIQKITEKQKMGIEQKPVSMGTAMYDQGRCLPWAMATPCIVCEEFCPTSPKAIWVEEVEVPKRESHYDTTGAGAKMTMVKVQRPHVDPTLCVGCGACEKVCPVVDKPAVYVTNAGESRSKTNIILLENTNYNQT
jgi:polyferredoxin